LRKSILLIGNFLSLQGANRTMAEEFALRLKNATWSVLTASSYCFRPLRLLDMLWTVLFRRLEYQVAYVEVYSGMAFLWAEVVCQLLDMLRKPYLLTLHGGNLPSFAHRWPSRVRRLLRNANIVTAPSRYLQEELRFYRENIVLISNPLEIKNYRFHLRSTPGPHLVWLRAFHNIYHPEMVPLVIANLRSSFPEIILTMIGPDKKDGSLRETQMLIEKIGLQKNIEIVLGIPKSKVPEYLEDADIFINTTNVDNTPVSVLEAMACGLCVVSTNVGGIPYLLNNEKDALLVPPNDPEAMATAVRRILTEPGLAARLSQNARCKVEQFEWSVILPQWEALFSEIINQHEGRQS
jgi:glycosyltransferase involved in cell wall biosynthesis